MTIKQLFSIKRITFFGLSVLFVLGCKDDIVTIPEENEESKTHLLGGDNTIFDQSQNAFSFQNPGLNGLDELNFYVGNSFFKQNWVAAPASTTARDGLGPTLNANNCSSCHSKDGRGRPPLYSGEIGTGLILRFSIGQSLNGEPIPHPKYGEQLQDDAIPSVTKEGQIDIIYQEIQGVFPDGETYSLRKPTYSIKNAAFGAITGTMISPRISRQLIGLGLLEAITDDVILSNADENDMDENGISGKPNYVWDDEKQSLQLGRFGWKADQSSIKQQVAKAFLRDIGITTSLYNYDNCPDTQVNCSNAANGGKPEIDPEDLDKITLYVSNLAVPAQRNYENSQIKRGQDLFTRIGCISCHKSEVKTGTSSKFIHLNNQTILPYSDLLLHNMGKELADDMPVYDASGQEWRTPPLWGIGLLNTVNNHAYYLHDGRARSIQEAILWHGGEAESRKRSFKGLKKNDRDALINFLKSL
jgi:CxxC motif-containing protein (DUF1111 family)